MAPQRIVSLVPSQTELLFDLGLDEEVVGITRFCIHPADKVAGKTRIGGTKAIHLDQIDALQPDLIIANKEENTRADIEWLQARFPVHITDMATLPDALAMIRTVGRLVGKEAVANELADRIERGFAQRSWERADRPSVAYLIWQNPYMVAAADTFIDAILKVGGFQNAFAGQSRYPVVSPEELQEARPDLIFLSSEPYPFKPRHRAQLEAICPWARCLIVDGEVFSWYGSRLLRAPDYLDQLHQQLASESI